MKKIFVLLAVGVTCFVAGYLFASYQNSDNTQLVNLSTPKEHTDLIIRKKHQMVNQQNIRYTLNETPHLTAENLPHAHFDQADDKAEADELTFEAVLNQILDGFALDHNQMIAPQTMDRLKQLLLNEPQNRERLIDGLSRLPSDNPTFFVLVSALKSLPMHLAQECFEELAWIYSNADTPEHANTFVSFLASAGASIPSTHFQAPLVSLVSNTENNLTTRIDALSLLSPNMLNNIQRNSIVSSLLSSINDDSMQDLHIVLPHLLKFSSRAESEEIVRTFISQDSSEPKRKAILENVDQGNVPIFDELSQALHLIATDPNDTLRYEAQDALDYIIAQK
jgi:hypothetical protein